MQPWVKRVMGVLCHVPAAYLLFHFSSFFWMLGHMSRPVGPGTPFPFASVFALHLLVTLVLLAFWLLWLWKAAAMTIESKAVWVLGLLFGAPGVMPILYWVHLRRVPDGPYLLGVPLR